MALDLDKTQYSSTLPTFRDGDSGSFTIPISGTVGASATRTWSNSVVFARAVRMIRYSMGQSPVPGSIATPYTSSDRLPLNTLVGGSNFSAYIGCSVAGIPAVTSIAPNIYVTSTTSGATVTVSITNPNAGTMTVTDTTITVYYTAFEIVGES